VVVFRYPTPISERKSLAPRHIPKQAVYYIPETRRTLSDSTSLHYSLLIPVSTTTHHRVIANLYTHTSAISQINHTTTKLALSHTRPSGRDAAAAPSPPTSPQLRKKSTRSSRPAPLSRSSTQEKLKRSARENARQAERREESEESFYDYWYVLRFLRLWRGFEG
jgi:hypothetical protein